ncbi:MAG: hypothetical protein NTW72_06455 [Gemmatimonadetes bacterium]|nr:hypothetical protein [Gemmatimonadota bacterium]
MRSRLALPLATLAGILALGAQFVAFSPPLPRAGEYFLTRLAQSLVGIVSLPLAGFMAATFGLLTRAHVALIGLAMVAVFPAIAVYEATRFRGSHNLMPFEFAMIAVCAVPLVLAAWIGRRLARRAGRGSPPSDEAPVA